MSFRARTLLRNAYPLANTRGSVDARPSWASGRNHPAAFDRLGGALVDAREVCAVKAEQGEAVGGGRVERGGGRGGVGAGGGGCHVEQGRGGGGGFPAR